MSLSVSQFLTVPAILGTEQNAAGGRTIYERPNQPTNEKHETNCKADATAEKT